MYGSVWLLPLIGSSLVTVKLGTSGMGRGEEASLFELLDKGVSWVAAIIPGAHEIRWGKPGAVR